jgi:hypothetical protein
MLRLACRIAWLPAILFLPLAVLAQERSWQEERSTHFKVFYKNATPAELDALTRKAEDCYESIARQFGFNRFNFWTWDNRAKIYLYDNKEEYARATRGYSWSGGEVLPREKLIQSYAGAPGFLHSILPHELAHIIFMEMVGFNNPAVPLWLHEGVATYQENDTYSSVKAEFASSVREGKYFDLDTLSRMSLRNADREQVKLFYTESYSLVKFLVSQFGKDSFVNFCRDLRDYQDLAGALRRIYSFNNLGDFQEAWKRYLLG